MNPAKTRMGAVVLLASLLLAGCGSDKNGGQGAAQGQNQQQQAAPREAQVMSMERRDIAYDSTYSAKLRSEQEAVVIARVRGLLEVRRFDPGEMVEKGESLYVIEPDVYQAAVNQRKADLQSAKAEANRAQREAERFRRLFRQNSVSEQDRDKAVAELQVARANVAQAQAALESAQVDLDYTNVEAPVSGMISLSDVNVGNVVDAGTELATITPMNPIEVRFSLPQEDAFDLRRQRQQQPDEITATLQFPGLEGTDMANLEGQLDFLGSRVDQQTSTVQARAMFENPDNMYLPGQFVRVKVQGMKRYDVMAVPEIAVTQGLMGPQVFVLDEDGKARTRNVTLGDAAGPLQVITDGLKPGDRVVVSDPGGLKAGTKVDPKPYSGDPEKLSAQQDKATASGQAKQQGQGDQQGDASAQQTAAADQNGKKAAEGEGNE